MHSLSSSGETRNSYACAQRSLESMSLGLRQRPSKNAPIFYERRLARRIFEHRIKKLVQLIACILRENNVASALIGGIFDLTGFSWARLIEIISLERNPGRCPGNDIAPSDVNGRRVTKLRQIEVLVAQGRTIGQACKEAEITEQSYYRWRNEYGGLEIEQAKRFKELERENARLKRLVADLSLEKQILKDVAEGNL